MAVNKRNRAQRALYENSSSKNRSEKVLNQLRIRQKTTESGEHEEALPEVDLPPKIEFM